MATVRGGGVSDYPHLAERRVDMKYAGLLVMPTGFFLAIAALILFPEPGLRASFVVCGLAVEVLGLGVALRGHMQRRPESPAVPQPGPGGTRGATPR